MNLCDIDIFLRDYQVIGTLSDERKVQCLKSLITCVEWMEKFHSMIEFLYKVHVVYCLYMQVRMAFMHLLKFHLIQLTLLSTFLICALLEMLSAGYCSLCQHHVD